ncbi:hypothetical protein OI25_2735 [Paraburkholderia fungorum]|jgi:uncharacterized iron-regulated membrane protein|uniref:Uncharacterized protein n=2 Tax=Paraburkholderia fungorum TaxID=134537 RepID=A0AAU8SYY5_9BURK|nr:hypothetical protein OI25_2735 [Paraburkholderia fungorum]PRZ56752.1 hypothetical protein BX589_101405 [Paraburkholderia fungorum]USX07626.1 hypothetical protein NHH62_34155 [Paraburkholderia fungorum]
MTRTCFASCLKHRYEPALNGEMAMFDVIPYWMWAASLLILALVCGAALAPRETRRPMGLRVRHRASHRTKWPAP